MDILNFATGLVMAELSKETGIDARMLKDDFKKFNMAIDELIALGVDENTAIKKVAENWKFDGII